MATLNDKLYAIGGDQTTSIEFFDSNNPSAGWQVYSQAPLAVERSYTSCVAITTPSETYRQHFKVGCNTAMR